MPAPSKKRSEKATGYRHLYKTARWQRLRARQLSAEPLCQRCKREGRITAATVCHHMDKASKENPETFYAGPFESRCAPCHDSTEQKIERLGFDPTIGTDGWPASPDHPANRVKKFRE